MNGTWVFLKKYTWRSLLLVMLTIVLLQLTGAKVTALTATSGQWKVVPSPNVGTTDNFLYGITAISPADVWAVGTSTNATLTEHWNGTQWSVIPSPSKGSYYPSLVSVTAVSTTDVWAVGYSGSYPNYLPLIEHWNGKIWKLVASPNNGATLSSVAASSANDIWAVGDIGTYQPIIEHWNGTQWSVVKSPKLNTFLSAVTAISANNIWAVGYTLSNHRREALIEHWDGTTWSTVANPYPPQSCLPSFGGVTAISATNVWAVGSDWGNCLDSPPYSLTEQWNGTQWNFVPSPGKTLTSGLSGVAAASTNNIWAVGQLYDLQQAATFHWDGTRWSNIGNPSISYSQLNDVAVTSTGDFWAVGNARPQGGTEQTLIEFYD